MDLQIYYQKVREIESTLTPVQTYITSLDTADGGKAGVVTQAPTPVAARMIFEGSARPATSDEIARFLKVPVVCQQPAPAPVKPQPQAPLPGPQKVNR